MLEKDIERKLVQEVKALGGMCLKFTSPGLAGVPDRIVMLPGGRIIFVEMKAQHGRLSQQQQAVLARFTRLGVDWAVVSTPQLLDIFLENCKGGTGE